MPGLFQYRHASVERMIIAAGQTRPEGTALPPLDMPKGSSLIIPDPRETSKAMWQCCYGLH